MCMTLPVQQELAALCKHERAVADCTGRPGLTPAQQVVGLGLDS